MKKLFKGKIGTVVILLGTLILAGVAIFTAIRLYELRQQPVAPNVPSSKPKAAASECTLTFTLTAEETASPTGTPTDTPSGTPTGTPTGTSTGTPTPTGTPGEPNTCNGTCGSDSNCQSSLTCYNGYCRNPSCPSDSDCVCPGTSTTPTPTPTQPALPESGTNWPTVVGTGFGILIIIGSLLLAL